MEIKVNRDGINAEIIVMGRLDTNTAPQFESDINKELEDINNLILDFNDVIYV